MKKCTKCKKMVFGNAEYCPQCGEPFNKVNNAYTCIHCGARYEVFSCVCPYCSQEQVGVVRSDAVKDFVKKLEEIEAGRKHNSFENLLNAIGKYTFNKADEQKINLISTFIVPNSKEDVLEFLILATSNIDTRIENAETAKEVNLPEKDFMVQKAITNAWKMKREQVYNKALLSFGRDSDFYVIKRIYERKEQQNKSDKESKKKEKQSVGILILKGFGIYILCAFILGLVLLAWMIKSIDNSFEYSSMYLESVIEDETSINGVTNELEIIDEKDVENDFLEPNEIDNTYEVEDQENEYLLMESEDNTEETRSVDDLQQEKIETIIMNESKNEEKIGLSEANVSVVGENIQREEKEIAEIEEKWEEYDINAILERLDIHYDIVINGNLGSYGRSRDYYVIDFNNGICSVIHSNTNKSGKRTLKYKGFCSITGNKDDGWYMGPSTNIYLVENDEDNKKIVNEYSGGKIVESFYYSEDVDWFANKFLAEVVCGNDELSIRKMLLGK